ncbi:hypothetical protein [Leptospira yasudae]|uniref:Uncharacterized protein n=1 Tax=Leptospira yasudae TaxID=2202201 RepID=A0A6N4QT90_9LEPT|nr:hypothetical protein [Leptospira yasudae]TGL75094.1 hypothetical protein EHQ72_16435 [Leptospira yasudae]TGL77930.1 hypothetical protein EHQ77_15170 [Leptospira yasudae]TGL87042.1 hypothetical protein EHQ83_05015 [Leptospira yasudae]
MKQVAALILLLATSFCKPPGGSEDLSALLISLAGGSSNKTTTKNDDVSDPENPNPSQSPFRPILNDLAVQTAYVTGAGGDDRQRVTVTFSFQNVPPGPLTLKAYLGRPNVITLSADGTTVQNYIQERLNPDPMFPNEFTFLSPETTQPYRIFVLASNSFGKSAKSILSTAPAPPAGPCANAVSAPTTIGNCAEHCIQVTTNGNLIEFRGSVTTVNAEEYLYMDLSSSTPSGGTGPFPFSYIELFSAGEPPVSIAPGTYTTELHSVNSDTYNENACIGISSYQVLDGAGGFKDSYLFKKVIIP